MVKKNADDFYRRKVWSIEMFEKHFSVASTAKKSSTFKSHRN